MIPKSHTATRAEGGAADPTSPDRDPQREEIAKAFESILLTRLMEQMKNSVGKWGFPEDAASGQIQGLFWMHLAREVSEQGGLGLWQQIYEFIDERGGEKGTDIASKAMDLRL